jgi:hypothetical protein
MRPWEKDRSWELPGKVLNGERPSIPTTICPPDLTALIKMAWDNEPSHRPTAAVLLSSLLQIAPPTEEHHSSSSPSLSIPFSDSSRSVHNSKSSPNVLRSPKSGEKSPSSRSRSSSLNYQNPNEELFWVLLNSKGKPTKTLKATGRSYSYHNFIGIEKNSLILLHLLLTLPGFPPPFSSCWFVSYYSLYS